MSRIIFLGGSFDPVHLGHLALAEWINEELKPRQFLFVPAWQNPHKGEAGALASHRLEMLEIATRDTVFSVDTCDLDAGTRFTWDTVMSLRGRLESGTQLSMVIGADLLRSLPRWHRADELARELEFLVVGRPGVSHTMELLPANSQFVPAPLLEISSSVVRERIGKGVSVKHLLPVGVWEYIIEHGLYSEVEN